MGRGTRRWIQARIAGSSVGIPSSSCAHLTLLILRPSLTSSHHIDTGSIDADHWRPFPSCSSMFSLPSPYPGSRRFLLLLISDSALLLLLLLVVLLHLLTVPMAIILSFSSCDHPNFLLECALFQTNCLILFDWLMYLGYLATFFFSFSRIGIFLMSTVHLTLLARQKKYHQRWSHNV